MRVYKLHHYPKNSNLLWIVSGLLVFSHSFSSWKKVKLRCCSVKEGSSTTIFYTSKLVSTNMPQKIINIIQSLFTDFLQMHISIMALQGYWCMHLKENRLGIFDKPLSMNKLPTIVRKPETVSVFMSRLHLFSTVHNPPYLPPCQPVSFIYCHAVYLSLPSTDGPSIT